MHLSHPRTGPTKPNPDEPDPQPDELPSLRVRGCHTLRRLDAWTGSWSAPKWPEVIQPAARWPRLAPSAAPRPRALHTLGRASGDRAVHNRAPAGEGGGGGRRGSGCGLAV
eukprot:scaffold4722_cov417-Prasinococcus_capsulatus_cf.AAC.4